MPAAKLNQLEKLGSANTDWGAWPVDGSKTVDERTVDYCIERMMEPKEKKPLFLACGLFRPHMPFFAPQSALDDYPLEQTRMPVVKQDDMADVPPGGRALAKHSAKFWHGIHEAEARNPGLWREAVRAYQAAATFADRQIGRLLDAIEASGRKPVIVLWSDHGYQLGEKGCWEKFTLWEKANRIPLIVVAPGVAKTGTRCDRPVDLTALYPTLAELCGLPAPSKLDGKSIIPLLKNPSARWERPALMTYGQGNHAVRSDRWRYIRYADGSEELYDHDNDPHEWNNLASNATLASVKQELSRWFPASDAAPAADYKPAR